MSGVSPFELPKELLALVFRFFDKYEKLASLCRVSRFWHSVGISGAAWRENPVTDIWCGNQLRAALAAYPTIFSGFSFVGILGMKEDASVIRAILPLCTNMHTLKLALDRTCGFVDVVRFLKNLPNLTDVDFAFVANPISPDPQFCSTVLPRLKHFRPEKHLNMDAIDLTRASSLTRLDIAYPGGDWARLLDQMAALPLLNSLSVSGVNAPRHFVDFARLKNLTCLSIHLPAYPCNQADAASELSQLHSLTDLHLDGLCTEDSLASICQGCPELVNCVVSLIAHAPESGLLPLARLPKLQSLGLTVTCRAFSDISPAPHGSFPALRTLMLGRSPPCPEILPLRDSSALLSFFSGVRALESLEMVMEILCLGENFARLWQWFPQLQAVEIQPEAPAFIYCGCLRGISKCTKLTRADLHFSFSSKDFAAILSLPKLRELTFGRSIPQEWDLEKVFRSHPGHATLRSYRSCYPPTEECILWLLRCRRLESVSIKFRQQAMFKVPPVPGQQALTLRSHPALVSIEVHTPTYQINLRRPFAGLSWPAQLSRVEFCHGEDPLLKLLADREGEEGEDEDDINEELDDYFFE